MVTVGTCLGRKHAEMVFMDGSCPHCEDKMSIAASEDGLSSSDAEESAPHPRGCTGGFLHRWCQFHHWPPCQRYPHSNKRAISFISGSVVPSSICERHTASSQSVSAQNIATQEDAVEGHLTSSRSSCYFPSGLGGSGKSCSKQLAFTLEWCASQVDPLADPDDLTRLCDSVRQVSSQVQGSPL